ncbi:EAL domain-containing protein [Pseudomonas sp. GD03860]|nr:EAL domain-containing protein [Pseudomonas sp. GD03860]MDH0640845.1 EAL domain-containing protein [Pseudomonas sp. GD03860]
MKATSIAHSSPACIATNVLDIRRCTRRWLSVMLAFLIVLLLVAWQHLYFGILDAREQTEADAGAILMMAAKLDIETVAEGVETLEQANWLTAAGCQMMQGFLFGKAMQVEQLLSWSRSRRIGTAKT